MKAEDLPQVSQDAVNRLYAALTSMEVLLDPDPLRYGPGRLNKKISATRGFLSQTEAVYLKISSLIQQYKAAHRTAELTLDLEKMDLYANNVEIRSARNQSTQEALATYQLRPQVELASRLASTRDDLVMIMSAVKSKKADLKDAQGRLRDQLKLCQEQIGLGQRWGSKPAPRKVEDPTAAGLSPASLTELFKRTRETGKTVQEVEQEMLAEQVQEEAPPLHSYPYLGLCSVCGEPQHQTPDGSLCENGHLGATTVSDVPPVPSVPPVPVATEPEPEPQPKKAVEGSTAEADFLDDLLTGVLTQEPGMTAEEQNIANALDGLFS